jgi:hypothetical protein
MADSDLSVLHIPASIALNAVTMNLNAPVTMTNDVPNATNFMNNDLLLIAEGESNVSANGAVAIGVTGEAVSMNGISNAIRFGVETLAGNWSVFGLYGHSGVQLNDVTMALNAPVSMINDLSGTVAGATNLLDMDFDLRAYGDSDIAANGSVAIGANGDFVSLSGASNTINLGINAVADGEFYVPGKHAGIVLNAVTMNLNGPITMDNNVDGTGAVNMLDLDYVFSTDADSDIVANGDMATTLAGSAVSMTGTSNTILFGVDAIADGEYVPSPIPLHKQSRIEIGAVSMLLAAPITMTNDISDIAISSNLLEMDYDLAASGEGDIVVSGDAAVTVIGNVNMTANDNALSALINFDAGVQSKVDVGSHNVSLLINGDVTMRTIGDASNTIGLGYIKTEDIAVLPTDSDGQVIATGSYTVMVNGDILMAGIGATNTLTIEKNVTVTGAISMGIVMGDTLSALNTLNLTDPGSFSGTTITMIAGINVATLSGSGVLSETLSIYGGTNTLTVGANVTINDIVSFGGIYDKDAIGTEGYVILKNLANTINVFGIVNGIDTSIDLNAPVGVVNDSQDTITITGSSLGVLNVVNDIITGNGNDSIDIQGGNVGGDVIMGDRASGAVGKNRIRVAALKIPATLTTPELLIPASVAGSVSMESTTFNRIDVRGLFQVNTDGSHTATSASIGGNATMNALTYDAITGNLDESIGDNLLTMEETSTISGAVAMAAGKSNTMTVRTGEIDTFVGGPVGGTLQDSIASVASIKMVSAANSLSVDKGLLGTAEGTLNVTSVIAGTTNGISMTQDQAFRLRNPLSTYTNTITVEADGRLVLTSTSDILMGNTVNAAVQGAYAFDHVTLNPSHVEVYYFNWNGGTNENVYDTTLNTITDHGRMFADDVTMYAKTNVMTVDGGAGIINPAGEGAFDGGNITMQGGLLVGGGVLASESNTLTDTALFFSNKIDMYATSFNNLQITGETGLVPVPVGGYRSKVVGNVTMGTAAQVLVPAETGDNDALFVSTDVTGNIDMEALGARGDNSLKLTDSTVSGSVTTNAVAGSNTVNIDPSSVGTFVNMDALVDNTLLVTGAVDLSDVVTKSTIGTYADMSALTGSNTATINMGSVGTNVTMNTHNSTTGNNSLILNGYANPLNGHNVSKSTIGGNVSQTTAAIVDGNGNNTVLITNGDVTGNVTQDTFVGYVGYNQLTLVGNVDVDNVVTKSTIGGNVSQTTAAVTGGATNGDNTVTILYGDVTGNVTMDASWPFAAAGDNNLSVTGFVNPVTGVVTTSNIGGTVTMTTSVGSNTMALNMATIGGGSSVTMSAGTDNSLVVAGANVAGVVTESTIGGSVTQTAGTAGLAFSGSNTAVINIANVNGNVSQTAGALGGNNSLIVTGVDALNTSDIGGSVSQTAAVGDNTLVLDFGTIGAGATMLATLGSNAGVISDSTVTGSISQTAGTTNTLTIDPSNVTGSVTQSAGTDNTLNLIGANVLGVVTESTIGGSVTMTAGTDALNIGANTAVINIADVTGNVSQTAGVLGGNNSLTVTGVDALNISDIGGSVSQTAAVGDNTLTFDFGTIGAGATMLATLGSNAGVISDSTVTGSISQTAGTTNILTIDPSNVTGSVTQSAGTDNTLNLIGANVLGVVTESTIGGSVTMTAGTVGPALSGTNIAVINIADVTGNVSQTAGALGGNNSLTVTGVDALNISDIGGSVNQTAAVGDNTLILGFATLGSANLSAAAPVYGNTVVVDDASTITGALNTTSLDDSLTIKGDSVLTVGSVNTLGGNDTLNIAGTATVVGNVDMGDGDDALTVNVGATLTGNVQASGTMLTVAGVVGGSVTMTGASSQLDLTGATVNSVTMTSGTAAIVNVDGTSTVSTTLTTGAGDDTITIDGTVTGLISTGTGSDSVIVNGTTSGGITAAGSLDVNGAGNIDAVTLTAATGAVTLNIGNTAAATVDSVTANSGADITLTVAAGSTVTGAITTDTNDTITIDGTVGGLIDTGIGTDSVAVTGTVANITAAGTLLTVSGAGTIVDVTMTGASSRLDLVGTTVNSVTMTSITAATVNVGTGLGASTVNTTVTTGAGADTVNVIAGSTVTGNIQTGLGADTMTLSGTAGNIDMGADSDTLTLNVGNASVGTIEMGAGTNTVNISVAFDLSDITSTAGDLTIGGTSTAFTVSAGLGVAGQTTSVTDAAATLTFATSGNTVTGTLNTTAAANVLDASGIAAGGSLINAAAATSWDVLAVGDADMKLVGNAGFALIGDSVDLVTGAGAAVNLDNWYNGGAGITSVSLTVGATTVSLNWNIANSDYEGVVGANTWTLGDAVNTKLTLGITA